MAKNYEAQYKKAMLIARGSERDENGCITIKPGDLFPELKEPDWEQVRKDIAAFISKHNKNDDDKWIWLSWLDTKIFPHTYIPTSDWKPTPKQIEALRLLLEEYDVSEGIREVLETLYNDIKSL